MSYSDALADFIRAMELEGVKALEPIAARIASGELIRFRCDGDGHGRQNGWAILYLDQRPAGAFGNYRLGISRSEEHTSELQSLMRISDAVFCLKKKYTDTVVSSHIQTSSNQ